MAPGQGLECAVPTQQRGVQGLWRDVGMKVTDGWRAGLTPPSRAEHGFGGCPQCQGRPWCPHTGDNSRRALNGPPRGGDTLGHPPSSSPPLPPAAAGGGALAHQQDADYLFSSNAAHPDTRRIHESLNYLEGRATVFHSCYLSAWANAGTGAKPSVILGHFILPPACLQEEIRRKIGHFTWEQVDDSLAGQPNENLTDKLETARKGCEEEEEEEDALDLAKSSEEDTGSGAPAQGEFPYRALQEYPMSNMVTGYASARDMRKYVGELRDFIPGTSGYTVYWIQNEINIYSDVKTKMKRKF
ncbi:telomere repeats-binding bouquet formation protein 2 [Egretta garzetta]|nr:telomere repeats-binding bouquet formation protein 2 [Egretta garzetta]